jgi:hypothetical protein
VRYCSEARCTLAEPQERPRPELIVGARQMLFGVPRDENGHESIHYFVEAVDAAPDVDDDGVRQALSVIGAWRDLDWDAALDELDRIRHESRPTPIIDQI